MSFEVVFAHNHNAVLVAKFVEVTAVGIVRSSYAVDVVLFEKKYILFRDFSRLDDRTSQRANYIEWLYSDEDEHRQEIDELWQKRQQRLSNKKQK